MKLLERAKAMLGFQRRSEERSKPDPIRADLSVAVQRNERASRNAQQALEEMKMRDTLSHLTGKMK